jgi:hypothetical protein
VSEHRLEPGGRFRGGGGGRRGGPPRAPPPPRAGAAPRLHESAGDEATARRLLDDASRSIRARSIDSELARLKQELKRRRSEPVEALAEILERVNELNGAKHQVRKQTP